MGASELVKEVRREGEKVVVSQVSAAVLGTIQGTSLRLDNFEHAIPRSDYLVQESRFTLSPNPDTDHGTYTARLQLVSGDRVICIPVEGGRTYVVVGRVR